MLDKPPLKIKAAWLGLYDPFYIFWDHKLEARFVNYCMQAGYVNC